MYESYDVVDYDALYGCTVGAKIRKLQFVAAESRHQLCISY